MNVCYGVCAAWFLDPVWTQEVQHMRCTLHLAANDSFVKYHQVTLHARDATHALAYQA